MPTDSEFLQNFDMVYSFRLTTLMLAFGAKLLLLPRRDWAGQKRAKIQKSENSRRSCRQSPELSSPCEQPSPVSRLCPPRVPIVRTQRLVLLERNSVACRGSVQNRQTDLSWLQQFGASLFLQFFSYFRNQKYQISKWWPPCTILICIMVRLIRKIKASK